MWNLIKKSIGEKNNIFESFAHLNIPDPHITIYTDASLTGWGITDGKTPSGGRWDENEITHINVLQLKAIQFSVLTYCKEKNFKHIRIMSDRTTVIWYINKKGNLKSSSCRKIARESGFGVLVETYTLVQHTFQAKKILRQTKIL